MLDAVSFVSIPINTYGGDTEGRLVMVDGRLVALLSRLDAEYHEADSKGFWHLEVGLGPCDEVRPVPFKTLEDAGTWVQSRLRRGLSPWRDRTPLRAG